MSDCGSNTRDVCGEFTDPVNPDQGQCQTYRFKVDCNGPVVPTIYYANTEQSYTSVCDGLPYGTFLTGGPIEVVIPAGTFYSSVSQEDANAQALAAAITEVDALRIEDPCI